MAAAAKASAGSAPVVPSTPWVMNQSSSTGRYYWQKRREATTGSTSTYEPPMHKETILLEGFAPGPRDHGVWSLDRLVAADRQQMWDRARRNLGWRDASQGKLPDDAAAAATAMGRELLARIDHSRFPDLWQPARGAFVLLCPESAAALPEPVVWRGHTRWTPQSQWTALELMPHRLLQRSYARRGVHTLLGPALKKLESAASPLEGMHLYHLVRDNKVRRSLEVGMACGLSTLYILQGMLDAHQDELKASSAVEAESTAPAEPPSSSSSSSSSSASAAAAGSLAWKPADHCAVPEEAFAHLPKPTEATVLTAEAAAAAGFQHVSVDPFQLTQWEGAARAQVHVSGLSSLSSHLLLPSHAAMPAVERELGEGCMDLVFVDGMHLFDYTLVDLFLADRLTRVGGFIVLDDIQHAGVKDCVAYIATNYPHWRLLRGTACERTAATWVKQQPDRRKWNYHVPPTQHHASAAAPISKRQRPAFH